MYMKKITLKKVLPVFMAVLMLAGCFATSAFAAESTNPATIVEHPENTMSPTVTVYPIGTHAFYKVSGKTVTYADQAGEGYIAVPSAYISGSSYNVGNVAYGMYVTGSGSVHYVDLSVCYEKSGVYTYFHGTEDAATVSSDVDKATNSDNTVATDFYLNIDKDSIDPEGTTSEEVIVKATGDPRVEYEITVATKATYQVDVTVPLYVCMYGYGGDGNIVEPTQDAYRMKNYSTSNANTSATIRDITKVTHYTRIYDENHSHEELAAIAFNTDSGAYQYWYSMPEKAPVGNWIYNNNIAAEHLNATGETYVIYIDGAWSFKSSGVLVGDALKETVTAVESGHKLAADFKYGPEDQWNFGATPTVGQTLKGGKNVGMGILVSGIEAEPHTWRLVNVSTPVADLRRGELTMSIAPEKAKLNASAIDLSTTSGKLNISENGWMLDAPAVKADGTVDTPTSLGLQVNAQMAGGSVNAAGCTSVVTVTYTVIPQLGELSNQTNTAVTAVENNIAD